jgi:phage terminase small subunit
MPLLSAKEARFVAEYLVDGNGTRAAIAAGYGRAGARVAACRQLAKDNVQEALQARQTADATRLAISRQDAIHGFLEAIEKARARPDPDPAAMISGWREIGRMLGFYAPDVKRVQVSADRKADDELRRFEAMSDEDLRRLIAGEAVAPTP